MQWWSEVNHSWSKKKKSSQAIPNLPSLVPRLPTGMPIRIVNQIASAFYLSKSCLRFIQENRASILVNKIACAFWKACFFLNRLSPSFLPHRTAIGVLWSKPRLGERVFGCVKAIHLHLWINLLFVRYFPHFFSCFFLFVHQFICPKLKN